MEQDASSMPDPNELRLAANARFAANALDEALPLYSLAVEVARRRIGIDQQSPPPSPEQQTESTDELVIHLCNLSACLYKMEMYDEACHRAAEAVSVSGRQNLKALFRLARAQLATKEYSSAMETIQQALSRCDEELQQHEQLQMQAAAASDSNNDTTVNSIIVQRKEFEKLKLASLRDQGQQQTSSQDIIQSIKLEPRTPSIKEFTRPNKSSDSYSPLGNGNFSTVVICQHKVTNETFALKIIEKEECKKLAKRQHPNVFNEVAMERRILTQKRLPRHVNIIQCYHAMQGKGLWTSFVVISMHNILSPSYHYH